LLWAGTFHAIGARLLREYAETIGLAAAFTIHDREDSADLMNLVRHDLGFSKTEKRFPAKGTCLAIYSRVVNGENRSMRFSARSFPWCAMWQRRVAGAVRAICRGQAAPARARLRRSPALLGAHDAGALDRGRNRGRFDHVLVDEYQDTNRLQARVLLALRPNGSRA
jgi:DNA helicase-2/ATP-dependent DNA helicase PcrA